MNNKGKQKKKTQKGRGNVVSFPVSSGTARTGIKAERGSDTFVQSVSGSVNFDATSYAINPGNERNLALSKEAQKYDQYRFRRLTFRFVRSRAVTTTPGMVGLALDPNPNSATPVELTRFNAYEIRQMKSVYSELSLDIPTEVLGSWKFVRDGMRGTDLSLYDIGRLVVATQDEDNTHKIGFIEVHYAVEFRYFHLEPSTPIPHHLYMAHLTASETLTNAVPQIVDWDEIYPDGLNMYDVGGNLTPKKGQYLVTCHMLFADNTSETFATLLYFEKNNAALTPPASSNVLTPGCGPNIRHAHFLMAYIHFNGTDTFRVMVQANGNAGALTLPVNAGKLCFQALT
jgi:hypothetical protein